MRAIVGLVLALCCVVGGWASAQAEKRVALIVGNSAYAHISGLPNVPNDAAAIAALLKTARFEAVDVVHNAGVAKLRRALKAFAGKAADADVAVLYYAGHGIEVGQTNYLIPVDARLATDFDIKDETVPLDRVLQAMEPAKRLRLVLLDACRENPFLKSMKRTVATRTVSRGLGRVEPSAANTLIAFATKPNAVAEDGKGRNRPFTAALVRHLLTPGLDLRIALGKVRDEVMASTGGRQEPYVTSSLGGEVVSIVPGVAGVLPVAPTPHPTEAAEAWAAVKDSISIAQLEVIVGRYKGTVYADLARARIHELRKKQASAAPLPPLIITDEELAKAIASNPVRTSAPLTAAEERALRPKDRFKECDVCPEMVVVQAGSFVMGSSAAEIAALKSEPSWVWRDYKFKSEGPQHRVAIARPFAVGKFEVTFAEWDACVADNGCQYRPDDKGRSRGKRPVTYVSFDDIAKEYLPWLSRKTGKTYRLLTEAEWEYAARAGTTTRYAFGDMITKSQAGYDVGGTTVGSFQPNAFGLFDMHGNVQELVQDCWNRSYDGAPTDGSAWTTGDCGVNVVRGGSFFHVTAILRSAARDIQFSGTGGRIFHVGFRVARTL